MYACWLGCLQSIGRAGAATASSSEKKAWLSPITATASSEKKKAGLLPLDGLPASLLASLVVCLVGLSHFQSV